jgi:cbb3-type cytochrome oxidase subunit 3
MTLILLEALGALLLLILIVWWTMFSGRKKGELPDRADREENPPPRD